ncbi:MAG: hypothetical protein WCG04_03985 [Alphaproteobacteria bacterium]
MLFRIHFYISLILAITFYSVPLHAAADAELKGAAEPARTQAVIDSFQGDIVQKDPNFYVSKIKDRPLWLVMERITDDNYTDWKKYALQQDNQRFHIRNTMGRDGTNHFFQVFKETSYRDNEIWVAYVTRERNPQPNPVKNLPQLSNENLTDDRLDMFVTVTSNPNALITSHMGVSLTIANFLRITKHKNGSERISMDLHSFAAKVMLMRNPELRYMVNAPTAGMGRIIAKAVPQTFIGTKELSEEWHSLSLIRQLDFAEFKSMLTSNEEPQDPNWQSLKEKWAQKQTEIIDRANSYLADANNPENKTYIPSGWHNLLGQEEDGHWVISQVKVEKVKEEAIKRFQKGFHLYDKLHDVMPDLDDNAFNQFLLDHPPIISYQGSSERVRQLIIYDEKDPMQEWLKIDQTNRDDRKTYNWIFTEPFAPAGFTHYVAVDLVGLASSIKHERPQVPGMPQAGGINWSEKISWNGKYPYIPGNGGIKHYLYRGEFEKMFPDEITFKTAFPGRDYENVEFPDGYKGIGPSSPRLDIAKPKHAAP